MWGMQGGGFGGGGERGSKVWWQMMFENNNVHHSHGWLKKKSFKSLLLTDLPHNNTRTRYTTIELYASFIFYGFINSINTIVGN